MKISCNCSCTIYGEIKQIQNKYSEKNVWSCKKEKSNIKKEMVGFDEKNLVIE